MTKNNDTDPGNRKGYKYPSKTLIEEDRCPFKEGSKFAKEWKADKEKERKKQKEIKK